VHHRTLRPFAELHSSELPMTAPDTLVLIEGGRLQPFGFDPFQISKDLGLRTILVTGDTTEYLKSAVSRESVEKNVDRVIEADISDAASVVASLRDEHAAGRLLGVFSITEYCVVVVAEVAHALGLPGLSPAAGRDARQKQRTRQICSTADVPVPNFAWVQSADQARKAAEELGSPCVVKPPSEAGGIGVKLCSSPDEAGLHYDIIAAAPTDRRGNPRPMGALVEEYVVGYQVSVEVVHFRGAHHVIGVTDELYGPHPHFVAVGETYPSLLPEKTQRECADVAVKALRAIGHNFGVAHVEVKVTAKGPLLIEVNARLPGAQITRLIHEAHGIHLPREVIRIHAGLTPDLNTHRDQAAAARYLTSPAAGVLTGVRGLPLAEELPGVAEVALYLAPGDRIQAAENIRDVLGYVIALGETAGEAARRADAAALEIGFDVASPEVSTLHG